jgi:hypothetical protein
MRKSLSARVSYLALVVCSVLAGGLFAVLPSTAFAEVCPNAAFRTGPSSHLPDCRAYEMVTPPFKNGAAVNINGKISPDGSAVQLESFVGFAGIQSLDHLNGGIYTSARTAAGWVTSPIVLSGTRFVAEAVGEGANNRGGTSLDLGTALWWAREQSQSETAVSIYAHSADGTILDVGPGLPPSAPPSSTGSPDASEPAHVLVAGLSADASHVLFSMGDPSLVPAFYWPFDHSQTGFLTLYEYVGTGNTAPMLVGVDDSGKQISQCGMVLGRGGQGPYRTISDSIIENAHNAVSADGSRVFFIAYAANSGCSGVAPPVTELYGRVDNGLPDAHTVMISEPSKADCSACDTEPGVLSEGSFEGASADGSEVFFSTGQPLLDGMGGLYEYDFNAPAGERIVRVSAGDGTAPKQPAGVGVQGVAVQISEDGSHVYFVDSGVLTDRPNKLGQSAEMGAENLYVFERDARYPTGRISYIATLSGGDAKLWESRLQGGADTTPDGRFLVFTSVADLTPDDFSTADQVFEYDAREETLTRVSIGQDGFKENGNTNVNPAGIVSPEYTALDEPAAYWGKLVVSEDGWVAFQSSDALTPDAIDDPTNGLSNIYEYRDGNVYLISDGRDIAPRVNAHGETKLVGMDLSGRDVFFTTTDQLVGQDTDTNSDTYDARVDGGFPAPAVRAECQGDSCQGPLSSAPVLLSPGSEFQAGGNPPLAGRTPAVKSKVRSRPKKHRKKRKIARRGARARRSGRAGSAKSSAIVNGGRS